MKEKLAALRLALGAQLQLMETNVDCSTEAKTTAFNAARAEHSKIAAQIGVLEPLVASLAATPAAAPAGNAVELAQQAERTRVLEITKIQTTGKLDATLAATHIADGTTVEEFRRIAFEALAQRSNATPQTGHHVELLRDQRDTLRLNAGHAIMHLFDRKNVVEAANDFRGMSIRRLAEELLTLSGTRVRGLSNAQIAELSMHATADFPYVLENSARKQLLASYETAQPTYRIWAKASTTPDFKTMSRSRLSETPSFLKVPEGAQITLGTMSETREQYALATYGRGVSFTRQMLINDDLNAFRDLISQFGLQAGRLENKTAYAILTANAALLDTVALFHATHANLGTGVIGNTGLDSGFTAMAVQKGLDGQTVLNLVPKYLVVPVAKKVTAQNAMTATGPNVKTSDQNNFAGLCQVVADAELDGTSALVWYLFADQGVAPVVEYCHLEGAEGPQIIRKDNEGAILGVQLYAFLDFAAKAVDFRGGYKSSGA